MDPFLSLPLDIRRDILVKIITYVPIAQWASLELLDKNFRAATWIAWGQLRHVNVEREFVLKSNRRQMTQDDVIESILRKLVHRSKLLRSFSGFPEPLEPFSNGNTSLAEFEHLQSISMDDAQLEAVVEFLESTRSRATLKELRLNKIVQWRDGRETILNRFATSFVKGVAIRSPLMLEKFTFSSSVRPFPIRLNTIDPTRLTELRLGKGPMDPKQLSNLIRRASNLDRIALRLYCGTVLCEGEHLQDYMNLLAAVASLENLTVLKFSLSGDCDSMNFEPEFIDMLQTIGNRRQLRKFSLVDIFHSRSDEIAEICATICEYIPYVRSIKLDSFNITKASINNIVSLADLEEIHLGRTPAKAKAIEKLPQLPHLKRLAYYCRDNNKKALKRLADVSTLTDVRIENARCISADIFDKWSDGLASNLQILVLSQFNEEGEDLNESIEKAFIRLLEKAVHLRVLILEGRFTDHLLMAIAKSCQKLEVLGVRWKTNVITLPPLQEIVDRCPRLKRFGGFLDDIRDMLRIEKISNVDAELWKNDFDGDEYD